jgi:hypothetical protein
MDDYPSSYTARPRPLLFLAGLGNEVDASSVPEKLKSGPKVELRGPSVAEEYGAVILKQFQAHDVRDPIKPRIGSDALQFRIRAIGKVRRYCHSRKQSEMLIFTRATHSQLERPRRHSPRPGVR